jgi:hypothetical protein
MTEPENNIVLIHLQGLRREVATVLDNQQRDREIIARLQRDMNELRNDVYTLEREGLNRHTEMLRALERIESLIPNAVGG